MAGLGGFGGFGGGGGGQAEQAQIMAMMQDMQVQDSLRMYNELVQRCFGECVDSFRSKTLDGKEEACITKCAEKFIKLAGRASQRFAEHQQMMLDEAQKNMEAGAGAAAPAGGSSGFPAMR